MWVFISLLVNQIVNEKSYLLPVRQLSVSMGIYMDKFNVNTRTSSSYGNLPKGSKADMQAQVQVSMDLDVVRKSISDVTTNHISLAGRFCSVYEGWWSGSLYLTRNTKTYRYYNISCI